MSGIEKLSSLARCLSTVRDINQVLEFGKKWQDKYNIQNAEVCTLIREGYEYHVDFLKYLRLVKNTCDRSCAALNNIKMELEIAIETHVFDNIFLLEIQGASQTLTATFESLREKAEAIKRDTMDFNDALGDKNKSIKSDISAFNNTTMLNTILAVFNTCATISKMMDFETSGEMLLIVGGSVAGAALLIDDQSEKLGKSKRLNKIVSSMKDQNLNLYASMDTFSKDIQEIQEDLDIFFDGFQRDLQQGSGIFRDVSIETRLITKARGMIEEIDKILVQLRGLKIETIDNSESIRAKLRLKNPRSLIGL